MTALHWAALKGDIELTDMLLHGGGNVMSRTRLGGYTPLSLAAEAGHGAVAAALINASADVNAVDTSRTTVLMLAAASGDEGTIRVLLDHGADVHAREGAMEQTALMFAAAHNRVSAIRILLARGAQLEASSKVVNLVPTATTNWSALKAVSRHCCSRFDRDMSSQSRPWSMPAQM